MAKLLALSACGDFRCEEEEGRNLGAVMLHRGGETLDVECVQGEVACLPRTKKKKKSPAEPSLLLDFSEKFLVLVAGP